MNTDNPELNQDTNERTFDNTEKLKQKARIISVKEGAAYGVFDGFGLRYITPYALLLGAKNSHIGFLSSIPQLFGNISQLYTLRLMEKGFRRKHIAFVGVLIQALLWFPIIALGILHFFFGAHIHFLPTLLIIFYSLLIISGTLVNPAWSSWMSDIIPKEFGGYFGSRNRVVGIVTLVSMLTAGFVLEYFKKLSVPVFGFIILFLIAFMARSTSSFLLKRQYEPAFRPKKEYYFTIWQFMRKIPESNFGKFVAYAALINLTTSIASPFFAVYMLKDLRFSYVQFTIISIIVPFSTLIFMPAWGRFTDTYGNLKTLHICGYLVPIIPLLWCVSPLFHHHIVVLMMYLIIIESFSGIAWAGFILASGNFVYDAVTKQRVAICVAYFNIFNGFGVFVGASIGGLIASAPFQLFGVSVFILVFIISGIARLGVSSLMLPLIKEVRDVRYFGIKEVKEKLSMLSPNDVLRYFSMRNKNP